MNIIKHPVWILFWGNPCVYSWCTHTHTLLTPHTCSRLDRIHLRRYHEYSEREALRPGVTRLSFPYFMDNEAVDYIIQSVVMVAKYGWKLLPQVYYKIVQYYNFLSLKYPLTSNWSNCGFCVHTPSLASAVGNDNIIHTRGTRFRCQYRIVHQFLSLLMWGAMWYI